MVSISFSRYDGNADIGRKEALMIEFNDNWYGGRSAICLYFRTAWRAFFKIQRTGYPIYILLWLIGERKICMSTTYRFVRNSKHWRDPLLRYIFLHLLWTKGAVMKNAALIQANAVYALSVLWVWIMRTQRCKVVSGQEKGSRTTGRLPPSPFSIQEITSAFLWLGLLQRMVASLYIIKSLLQASSFCVSRAAC